MINSTGGGGQQLGGVRVAAEPSRPPGVRHQHVIDDVTDAVARRPTPIPPVMRRGL